MKRSITSFLFWVLIFVVTYEINRLSYNAVLSPVFDATTGEINYSRPTSDLILLVVRCLSFLLGGALLGWRMRSNPLSVASAMLLGSLALAVEVAQYLPWFQLMPAHISTYDRWLAFVGTLSAPSMAGLGAYLCYRGHRRKAAATQSNNSLEGDAWKPTRASG